MIATIITNDFYYAESAKCSVDSLMELLARGGEYCFFFDNDVKLDSREVIIFQLPYSSSESTNIMNIDLGEYEKTATLKRYGIGIIVYKRKAD